VTFAELMTQLKHYSPGTRKDALLGLRDLFHRHPHLLPLHLGVLVNSVVRLLIDDVSFHASSKTWRLFFCYHGLGFFDASIIS
jgi:hypothetical protein